MFEFCGVVNSMLIVYYLAVQSVSSAKYHENYKLMEKESSLKNTVKRQINHQTAYISKMERWISLILSETSSKKNKDDYVSNPVTALTLVRRLTQDWLALAGMACGLSYDSLLPSLESVRWPGKEDLEAVTKAVIRVQVTYGLDTELVAQGPLVNLNITANLTATDGFNIAKAHIKQHHYAEAASWLQRSLGQGLSIPAQHSALQHLAAALCYSGISDECKHLIRKALEEDPASKTPEGLIVQYFYMSIKKFPVLMDAANYFKTKNVFVGAQNEDNIETYKKLCQGKGKTDSRLACRYVHYHQPHLRFQPFKLEELQLDPPVVRFYDAITDHETETIKKEAIEKMQPALIFGNNGEQIKSDYRTSFNAWIFEHSSELAKRLRLRMTDMTRLDTFYAEPHQVASYALSGSYLPHYDYIEAPLAFNRLATLMYYLSDVKQGGNTVFLRWNLTVAPIKNSAILWFNFRRDGQLDDESLHSGCPVLQGRKWVLNKWIWNFGGMPCKGNLIQTFEHFYIE